MGLVSSNLRRNSLSLHKLRCRHVAEKLSSFGNFNIFFTAEPAEACPHGHGELREHVIPAQAGNQVFFLPSLCGRKPLRLCVSARETNPELVPSPETGSKTCPVHGNGIENPKYLTLNHQPSTITHVPFFQLASCATARIVRAERNPAFRSDFYGSIYFPLLWMCGSVRRREDKIWHLASSHSLII